MVQLASGAEFKETPLLAAMSQPDGGLPVAPVVPQPHAQ